MLQDGKAPRPASFGCARGGGAWAAWWGAELQDEGLPDLRDAEDGLTALELLIEDELGTNAGGGEWDQRTRVKKRWYEDLALVTHCALEGPHQTIRPFWPGLCY